MSNTEKAALSHKLADEQRAYADAYERDGMPNEAHRLRAKADNNDAIGRQWTTPHTPTQQEPKL